MPPDDPASREPAAVEPPSGPRARPVPLEIIRFEPDEPGLLARCCNSTIVSPRAAKRLINVFKLLKIIWNRRGLGPGPDAPVKHAMLMLLSLSARHPEAMRVLLRALEEGFRGKGPPTTRKLRTFLVERCEEEAERSLWPQEWERVKGLISNDGVLPEDLTLHEMTIENVRLVTSFSFVGETDPERERAAQATTT